MCRIKNAVNTVLTKEGEAFLSAVHSEPKSPWMIRLKFNNQTINFEIDTGADVTVIPLLLYDPTYTRW